MATVRFTANQVVAFNLRRARGLHGWTQEMAAERLEAYLGVRWSKATFSVAERSVTGQRIRQFTADDITAFAAAFELPVSFFFTPPGNVEAIANEGAARELTADELSELVSASVEDRVAALQQQYFQRLGAAGIRVSLVEKPDPKGGNR